MATKKTPSVATYIVHKPDTKPDTKPDAYPVSLHSLPRVGELLRLHREGREPLCCAVKHIIHDVDVSGAQTIEIHVGICPSGEKHLLTGKKPQPLLG